MRRRKWYQKPELLVPTIPNPDELPVPELLGLDEGPVVEFPKPGPADPVADDDRAAKRGSQDEPPGLLMLIRSPWQSQILGTMMVRRAEVVTPRRGGGVSRNLKPPTGKGTSVRDGLRSTGMLRLKFSAATWGTVTGGVSPTGRRSLWPEGAVAEGSDEDAGVVAGAKVSSGAVAAGVA